MQSCSAKMQHSVNFTNCTETTLYKKIFFALSLFEMIISVLGSAGNALTCFAVVRNRNLHSATYFFVVSLAMADFLITSVLVPVRAAEHFSIYRDSSPPGATLLKVAVFIGRATILASLSSLVTLSIDRYMALRYPIKYRASIRYNFKRTFMVIASLWISSLIITTIPLYPGVSALQGLFIFVVLVFVMTSIMIISSWKVFRLLKQLSLRLRHCTLTSSSLSSNQFSNSSNQYLRPSSLFFRTSNQFSNPSNQSDQFTRRNKTTCRYTEIQSSPRVTRPRSQSLPGLNGISRLKTFDNKAFKSDDVQPVKLLNVTLYENGTELDEIFINLNPQSSRPAVTHSPMMSPRFNELAVKRKNQQSPQCNGSAATHNPVRTSMVRQLADGYIAKTIVIIIGTFVLCIYPRIFLIIYHLNFPETPTTRIFRLWLKVLLYMNSVINPVLYAWRFKDFRREFVNLIITFKKTLCG